MIVKVIGAGLAGCEAAYQLSKCGFKVKLYEQKPLKKHEAFKTDLFAELICSNSLRSNDIYNAVGLLKEEMRQLDSLIIKSADLNRVEAGSSLAVDRIGFSKYITDVINEDPNIEVINEEVTSIDTNIPTIICSGPLCEGELSKNINELCGNEYLNFFDAISPIVEKDSIDFTSAYYKDRWEDEKPGTYINCPLTKDEFEVFYNAVLTAEKAPLHGFDEKYFEGCMPFEEMARRGYKTLLFGPMKPVGLMHEGVKPYAVVQLRQDNAIDSLYNIVGFQTHLTFPEQKRVLSLIPALKNAKFARFGVMHRNTYINSPNVLNKYFQMIKYPNIFVAGQISGVEGYVESASSGLYSALCMAQYLKGGINFELSASTIIGALANYISDTNITKLEPMKAMFGIIKSDYSGPKDGKKEYYVKKSLEEVKNFKEKINV